MTTMTMTNGRPPRKLLSDQLDRLDSIIDALADGLPGAVAEAAREGTKLAVKDVLKELLSNPDVVTLIRAAASPPPEPTATSTPPSISAYAKLSNAVKAAASTVNRTAKRVMTAVVFEATAVWITMKAAGRVVRNNPRVRRTVVVGAGVGAVAAVVAACNHTVATTLSGLGMAATAVAVQGGLWLRAAGRRLGLVT